MINSIKIAVDAMGGENSPKKIIKGIEIHSSASSNIFYNIFGDQRIIQPMLSETNINKNSYKIIHTEKLIRDEDSPLAAAKKKKV